MTIILKKGISPNEINQRLSQAKTRKARHNFEKYVGVISLPEDPATIQKKLRDEWQ